MSQSSILSAIEKGIRRIHGSRKEFERTPSKVIPFTPSKLNYTIPSDMNRFDVDFFKKLNIQSMYDKDLKEKFKPEDLVQIQNNISENTYDVYIVATLDTQYFKFKQSQGSMVGPVNIKNENIRPIIWKWGSEKRFFDYLNVLCDELDGVPLELKIKEYGEMNVLSRLWRKYRDETKFKEGLTNPNYDLRRDVILKKNFEKSSFTSFGVDFNLD